MFPIGTILYIIDAGVGARAVNGSVVQVIEDKNSPFGAGGIQSRSVSAFRTNVLIPSPYFKRQGYPGIWRVLSDGQYMVYPYKSRFLLTKWYDSMVTLNKLIE